MKELKQYLRRYLDKIELELNNASDTAFDTDQLKMLLITAEETESCRLKLSVNNYDGEYENLKTTLENKISENLKILEQFEKELGL